MARRKTIQCALVLGTVHKLKCHATADEIHEELVREHPNISRGTVYRNLQRLCEAGEIRKIEIPCGADRFDHLCSAHYHIRCIRCGRVFDVDMEYMADLEQSIRDTHGFIFMKHDIIFQGVCPDCQNGSQVSSRMP